MATPTFTATQLITNAYYLAGVRARELDTVSGAELTDGLQMLNFLLATKSVNTKLIPYYSKYEFNAVQGQEVYFVPKLCEPETLTFNIGNVRYPVTYIGRSNYFGSGRVNNIQSLSFTWHDERCLGGSNIYLYFLPYTNFPLTVWGKFSLDSVTLNENLLLTYDAFYVEYLKYRLAKKICTEYAINMRPETLKELQELESGVTDISPADLTMNRLSYFPSQPGLTWAFVNLGQGWTPG